MPSAHASLTHGGRLTRHSAQRLIRRYRKSGSDGSPLARCCPRWLAAAATPICGTRHLDRGRPPSRTSAQRFRCRRGGCSRAGGLSRGRHDDGVGRLPVAAGLFRCLAANNARSHTLGRAGAPRPDDEITAIAALFRHGLSSSPVGCPAPHPGPVRRELVKSDHHPTFLSPSPAIASCASGTLCRPRNDWLPSSFGHATRTYPVP